MQRLGLVDVLLIVVWYLQPYINYGVLGNKSNLIA